MRILILEDEPPIAEYIAKSIRSILKEKIKKLDIIHTLDEARQFIKKNKIDLCFLDLNLSGEDGFDFLRTSLSMPFQTIVISAYTERAIQAYEYGVIDFVPKSLKIDRLRTAIDRYSGKVERPEQTKYLVSKIRNKNKLLPVKDIKYFKAVRYLVQANLNISQNEIIEKSLNSLEIILPKNFVRTHRSFIVNMDFIDLYENIGSGVYHVVLKDGTTLPLSRYRVKAFKKLFH